MQLVVSLLACKKTFLIRITLLMKPYWKKQIHCSATCLSRCVSPVKFDQL